MGLFNTLAILMVLTTTFSFINYRFLKLPATIGVMSISLVMSLSLVGLGNIFPETVEQTCKTVASWDFKEILMTFMLSFLIFAGAFNMNTKTLMREKITVLVFAVFATLISTFLVGYLTYFTLPLLGINIPLVHALLFGALISPTDPIAVLAILRKAKVNPNLEMDIAGESLLNDGVAVVVFTTILQIAEKGVEAVGFVEIAELFGREAIGGMLLGLLVGHLGYLLLKSTSSSKLDLMITLSVVMGGYAFASAIEASGPLAIVAAGLYMGARRTRASSEEERAHVDIFWEMTDEIMNAILFILMGLEILVISFTENYILAGMIAIFIILLSRLISVGISIPFTKIRHQGSISKVVAVLTWGGLRGGISVALALSLTPEMSRDLILAMTYIVVIFSILIQGLTIGALVKKLKLSQN